MKQAKSFLFITFGFPPHAGSGLQRIMNLTTLLPERGWIPLILTVTRWGNEFEDHSWDDHIPAEIKIFRAISFDPYRWFRLLRKPRTQITKPQRDQRSPELVNSHIFSRLKKFYHSIVIPDHSIWWLPGAFLCGLYIIIKHHPQVILATSGPYSSPIIGAILSLLTRVPLVLDFRDSWVNNPYHNFKGWRLQYETFLEAFCLKQAVAVVSVTEPIVEEFRLKCSPSKRVLNITNGFTIEPDLKLSTAPSDGFFRLVYTGLFYGNRTPEYFFTGLKRASELNPALLTHLKVIIAGKMPATYLEELRQFPLREMVDFRGFLPHSEVLEILSSANVLLLIQSDDDKGFYSSKLFEYLSVRKFILALAPFDGIAGQLIAKLCAGKVVQHNDIEAITKNILELYDAFSQGKIEAKHTLQDIWEFSWPGLADKYANLLNEIDSNRGCDNPAN